MKWHPSSRKLVFWLPSLALLGGLVLLVVGWQQEYCWLVILIGLLLVFIDALRATNSIPTSILGVVASMVQIGGYGWGFLKGWWYLHLFGRNPERQFPGMFKGPKSNIGN